jgi:RimJ/RimL family protein N-acetyltransferase
MRIVRGDESLRAWMLERLPAVSDYGAGEYLGVIGEDARILAGLAYYNYTGHSIEMSIAAESPRWCRKGIVRALLAYPFRQLGCARVTAVVHESNEKSAKLNDGLGFVREGFLRSAAKDGGGLIIYGLTKQDYEAGKYG